MTHALPPITVVSGLPRSGTSMLMQMLAAAGILPLTDSVRTPDPDNPHGYFELEAVKHTRTDPAWLDRAPGKAVKVIHALLKDLPPTHRYQVIFIHRNLDEVLASQHKMLERAGRPGARLNPDALRQIFAAQLDAARAWAASQPNISCLDVHHHDIIADPHAQAARIAAFLAIPDKAPAMAAAVESSLYRNRAPRQP